MKKINIKSGAMAAVLAGTMALSMVPATALAATVTDTNAPQTISKTWNFQSSYQYSKDETFTFELTHITGKDEKVGTNDLQDLSDFGTKTVSFTTNKSEGNSATGSAALSKIFDSYNFTKPGVYYFKLAEKTGDNKSITYSTETYTVQVSVDWADPVAQTAEVQLVNVVKGDASKADFEATAKKKVSAASFTNTTDKANNNLTVKKTVSGAAANTDDEFTFTVSLEGLQPGYTYQVTASDGVTVANAKADNDGKATVSAKLKHGQQLELKNLPDGAKYTVSEGDTDYTETYKVDNGESNEGLTTGEQTVKANSEVDFNNEKGFAPQTGITMNSLAGIGIAVVAVAGGATLVVSRRKRAGEDF